MAKSRKRKNEISRQLQVAIIEQQSTNWKKIAVVFIIAFFLILYLSFSWINSYFLKRYQQDLQSPNAKRCWFSGHLFLNYVIDKYSICYEMAKRFIAGESVTWPGYTEKLLESMRNSTPKKLKRVSFVTNVCLGTSFVIKNETKGSLTLPPIKIDEEVQFRGMFYEKFGLGRRVDEIPAALNHIYRTYSSKEALVDSSWTISDLDNPDAFLLHIFQMVGNLACRQAELVDELNNPRPTKNSIVSEGGAHHLTTEDYRTVLNDMKEVLELYRVLPLSPWPPTKTSEKEDYEAVFRKKGAAKIDELTSMELKAAVMFFNISCTAHDGHPTFREMAACVSEFPTPRIRHRLTEILNRIERDDYEEEEVGNWTQEIIDMKDNFSRSISENSEPIFIEGQGEAQGIISFAERVEFFFSYRLWPNLKYTSYMVFHCAKTFWHIEISMAIMAICFAKWYMKFNREQLLKWDAKLRNTCPDCFDRMKETKLYRCIKATLLGLGMFVLLSWTIFSVDFSLTTGYELRKEQRTENCALPTPLLLHTTLHQWKSLQVQRYGEDDEEELDKPSSCEEIINGIAKEATKMWHELDRYLEREFAEIKHQTEVFANFSKFNRLSKTYSEVALHTFGQIYSTCAVSTEAQPSFLQFHETPTLEELSKAFIRNVQAGACYLHEKNPLTEKYNWFHNLHSEGKLEEDEARFLDTMESYNLTGESWSTPYHESQSQRQHNFLQEMEDWHIGGWESMLYTPEYVTTVLRSIFEPYDQLNLPMTYWEWSQTIANLVPAKLRWPVIDLLLAVENSSECNDKTVNEKIEALMEAKRNLPLALDGDKALYYVGERHSLENAWMLPSLFVGLYVPHGPIRLVLYVYLGIYFLYLTLYRWYFPRKIIDKKKAATCIFCDSLFVPVEMKKPRPVVELPFDRNYQSPPVEYKEDLESSGHNQNLSRNNSAISVKKIHRVVHKCTWCDDLFVPKPSRPCKDCKKNTSVTEVPTYCTAECLSAHWTNGHKDCPNHKNKTH